MGFSDAALGARLLVPWRDQHEQTDVMKQFRLTLEGLDELTYWFMETLSVMLNAGVKWGTDMGNGVKRYVNNSNAGACFIYVKDGRIIRMTPIVFDKEDAPSFTIEARGKKFTPPRKTTLSPFGFSWKSTIYSPDRILYPMKRVDFNPNGERNCENRGVSGYQRISWDEAMDIVANENQTREEGLRAWLYFNQRAVTPHLGQPGILLKHPPPLYECHRYNFRGS